nr:hypothetical protein [Tanacetum cinerariifolium]
MVYVVNGVLASGVDMVLEKVFAGFALQVMYSIDHQEDLTQQRISDVHDRWDKLNESKNELLKMMQSFCEMAANLSTYSPEPSRRLNSFCYNGDDYEESTIPLNEIVSLVPSSIAITPVLPTEEPDDSLIIGDEDLSTILEKKIGRKNIKNKDSYDSNIDEPDLLVTPLSDTNEDECFDPSDDVNEIELLLHHDPSTPKMSFASILEGFTNEPPLEENDDLFDLESKENKWKKILYDAPIDDLITEDKIFDPGILETFFSPTYVNLPFKDRHYLFFTCVIRIFLPHFIYPVDSPFLLSYGSEDTIFDLEISAFHWHLIGVELSCALIGQANAIDEDVDEKLVQDLALNVDNVFQENDCDAFDSDVDEAPTAQTMFMANLSSAAHVYDEVNPSYDLDILSEVHDHDHSQDAVCEPHDEHEIHDSVQLNPVVDSHADYTSNSNMISYDQYVKDNAVPGEQVELYERQAKFELTEREQKINEQLRIVITDRNFKEESLKKELHSVKFQLASTINHNKLMVEEVTSLKKDFKQKENKYLEDFLDMKSLKEKVAIGYKNLLCLTRAKQVQHALYNGHEIIKDNHVPAIVHNTKDTLEIAKIIKRKMNDKMKDPECVNHKVKIVPHDYSKENFLATFTPQKQLTPKKIFWSQDLIKMKTEALKEHTTASRPIKALTVYPPNTPATLVPRVLPMKSQVKIHIFTLIQLFLEFDKTCKKRITPTGLTEGERGFEQTKECYLKESLPEHLKDKISLDAPGKLTGAKLNNCSRDANLSKDNSSPELPLEFRRSWLKLDERSREADLSKDISGPESPPELQRSWAYAKGLRYSSGNGGEVEYEDREEDVSIDALGVFLDDISNDKLIVDEGEEVTTSRFEEDIVGS